MVGWSDGRIAAQAEENNILLKALSANAKDFMATETVVRDRYAMLSPKVEEVAREEFGAELYDDCERKIAEEFGTEPKEIMKNAVTAKFAVDLMHAKGRSPSLESIVAKIAALA